MKISKIEIINLHNAVNYEVEFDEQLTFLFGTNGCGKTTVLNILAAVVTGKLYNLLEYEFECIKLFYVLHRKNKDDVRKITISMDKNRNMQVEFEEQTNYIPESDSLREWLFRKAEDNNIDRIFFDNYPFAKRIKETFNYVYLPLNRYGMNIYDENELFYRRSRMHRSSGTTYLSDSLNNIAEIIRDNCARINFAENRINEKFRREVLMSNIQVSSEMNFLEIIKGLENIEWNEIEKSRHSYIKSLEEIGILDETVQHQLDVFFEDLRKDYDEYKNNRKNGIKIDLTWKYSEFLKINNIVKLAKQYEERKEKIRKPRELFLEVLNSFFETSDGNKKVRITSAGQVVFETNYKGGRKLVLEDLSSGEKQIVIIFASLIFGLQNEMEGIYIVDEPEASLHLSWQSKFVSSILKVNKNVQLIFATHSPELIGRYSANAVMLEKR